MAKTFKFKGSEIEQERWCWECYYSDGTTLRQFEGDGTFHQFKEIDQTKLLVFRMGRDDASQHIELYFRPGMKLIHYYLNSVLENGRIRLKSYCFGYEKNINGSVFKHIITILPSDNLTITDERPNLI